MSATLIVNPYASNVTEERVRAIEQLLEPAQTLLTERRGHATELARAAQGDTVIVFGGDGVLNEVLNGLERDVPLGVLPGGHTNVFARALGLPRDPVGAAAQLGRSRRRISLGRVNGRRFGFASGIGVDAEAVRELETVQRAREGRRPGDLEYARTIVRRLLQGYEPALELRGLGRAAILFVSNDAVFTYAGPLPLRFSPRARFELGLDAVAPEHVTNGLLALAVARLAAGRGLAGTRGVLDAHDLDRLEVTCDRPLPLQADGEDLGDVTEAVFEAERAAITVLTGYRSAAR
jgi:diacylglycerol kinase family enzyme